MSTLYTDDAFAVDIPPSDTKLVLIFLALYANDDGVVGPVDIHRDLNLGDETETKFASAIHELVALGLIRNIEQPYANDDSYIFGPWFIDRSALRRLACRDETARRYSQNDSERPQIFREGPLD